MICSFCSTTWIASPTESPLTNVTNHPVIQIQERTPSCAALPVYAMHYRSICYSIAALPCSSLHRSFACPTSSPMALPWRLSARASSSRAPDRRGASVRRTTGGTGCCGDRIRWGGGAFGLGAVTVCPEERGRKRSVESNQDWRC